MDNNIETAENVFRLAFMLRKKLTKPVVQQSKIALSPIQAHILDILKEKNQIPMTILANEIRMSKQQMCALVNKLVAQGIVQREYDRLDRRTIKISLTEKGLALLDRIKKESLELMILKLQPLGDKNLLQLNDSLCHLMKLLEEIP